MQRVHKIICGKKHVTAPLYRGRGEYIWYSRKNYKSLSMNIQKRVSFAYAALIFKFKKLHYNSSLAVRQIDLPTYE